jgi:hypothetical protein
MGHYVRRRAGNGRFRRSTLERDFGIKAWACAYQDCRGFNPTGVGEGKPTTCKHCGRPFVDIAEGPLNPDGTPKKDDPQV